MNLVVDASVAAKWILREVDADKALDLQRDARFRGVELIAPEILPAEIANALWKRVIREHLIPTEASKLYGKFSDLCPQLIRLSSLVEPALKLAVRFGRSVCDSLYVALALEARCPLVTADERLFQAFSPAFPQVQLLRDWA